MSLARDMSPLCRRVEFVLDTGKKLRFQKFSPALWLVQLMGLEI